MYPDLISCTLTSAGGGSEEAATPLHMWLQGVLCSVGAQGKDLMLQWWDAIVGMFYTECPWLCAM